MTIFEPVLQFNPRQFYILAFIWLVVFPFLEQKTALAQPLPDGEETLAVEAQSISIPVPKSAAFKGGHLQGVQIHNETLIVSGSSTNQAYLAIFQLLGGEFRFVGTKPLASGKFNHAGGLQVAENWLVVGIEDPVGKRSSIIQLIDISSFEMLSGPPVYTLERRGEFKRSTAGAVALLKRDDHFLLAVGSWDSTVIDFYVSNGVDPYKEGFEFKPWTSWDSREAKRKNWTDRDFISYQSLQFSEDSTGLFITGFAKKGNSNQAHVYALDTDSDPYNLLTKVATYSVQCRGDVTFRNGAGLATFHQLKSIVAVGHQLTPTTNIQIFPVKNH